MSCLISKDTLKALWGLAKSDVTQDPAIDVLIDQCSTRIETYCRRVFAAANYTEYYSGNGDRYLPLKQRPINTVASVYQDDTAVWGQGSTDFAVATLLTAGTDYVIVRDDGSLGKSGMLYRVSGVWTKFDTFQTGTISPKTYPMTGNIKVTYNAGYATIPGDIQQACAMLIAAVKRIVKLGAPTSAENWEDYGYTLANAAATAIGGLPPDTLGALASYRNQSFG